MLDLIPFSETNYMYIIRHQNECIFVDTGAGVADKALDYLQKNQCSLKAVFITHHHGDHIGDTELLREKTGCLVYGNLHHAHRLPHLTHGVQEGDQFTLLNKQWQVIDISGHTQGHLAFYNETNRWLFCGDTLFSLGCGRLFEGTPQQMWDSISKIAEFPDDVLLCPAHEYTVDNAEFCLSFPFMAEDEQFVDYVEQMKQKRLHGKPTVPTLLSDQKRFNPFMRVENAVFRKHLGFLHTTADQGFAQLRQMKDIF